MRASGSLFWFRAAYTPTALPWPASVDNFGPPWKMEKEEEEAAGSRNWKRRRRVVLQCRTEATWRKSKRAFSRHTSRIFIRLRALTSSEQRADCLSDTRAHRAISAFRRKLYGERETARRLMSTVPRRGLNLSPVAGIVPRAQKSMAIASARARVAECIIDSRGAIEPPWIHPWVCACVYRISLRRRDRHAYGVDIIEGRYFRWWYIIKFWRRVCV